MLEFHEQTPRGSVSLPFEGADVEAEDKLPDGQRNKAVDEPMRFFDLQILPVDVPATQADQYVDWDEAKRGTPETRSTPSPPVALMAQLDVSSQTGGRNTEDCGQENRAWHCADSLDSMRHA